MIAIKSRLTGSPPPGVFATSQTYNGVTFNFDTSLEVGNFVTGEPWVVSSEAFNITSITPISETINGGVANGAMKDPYPTITAGLVPDRPQGFDQFLGTGTAGFIVAANHTYDAAVNIDPAISGSISVTLGEETSIVKTVRLSSVTNADQWTTIEKYVPLHVLSSAPPANAYPPTSSGLTKTIWTRDNVNEAVL